MSDPTAYTPPKIWTWNKESGGRFANINRPVAGPTHEKDLPVGRHPMQLYSLATPNGVKVTVMLEELLALGHSGAEYDAWLIRINAGDQFGSGFVAVNPNSKIPALMDRSGPQPIRVFESGAILIHLAEKFGALLPTEPAARAECLSWLMWQMGSAPYLGGGFGHFYAYAPTKIEYAIDRFAMEVKRQMAVEDVELALGLHGEAIDGVFDLGWRIGIEMAEAAAKIGRAAHLPEQPRQAFGAGGRLGRQEGAEFFRQIHQDRARLEHADRLCAAAVHQRRNFRVGIGCDKTAAELVAVLDPD